MATYEYSIASDFPNHKVATGRLSSEIQSSAITIALDAVNTSGDVCSVVFKANLSGEEETILDGLVAAHSGEPLPEPGYEADGTPIISLKAKQPDGIPVFANAPRDGSEWVVGTHNFCDPCSWFGDSIRVANETLTDSGDGLTFTSAHVNWIDMVSGRMHNDDVWVQIQQMMDPADPHGYQVVVKVDGTEQTMRAPFATSGGDYEVNWDDGTVTFFSSKSGSVVTASYSYATTNTFYLRPMPGKRLAIEDAEADISSDVHMCDPIAYSAWHFDPETMAYVCDMEAKYKRAGQIITEARGCYPEFTAIGASDEEKQIEDIREFRRVSRGMKYNRQAIPFQYATVKWLRSAWMQEVRVYTASGDSLVGETVTMTFYCSESDES